MKIESKAFLVALLIVLLAGCNADRRESPDSGPAGMQSPAAASREPPEPVREESAAKEDTQQLEEDKSYVFVEKDTDGTDGGFANLVETMGHSGLSFYQTEQAPAGIIGSGDVVLVKINCQWAERGGTNVDLLESVVAAIVSHPDGFTGEIIIADNGQRQYGTNGTGGSLSWPRTNAGDQVKTVADVVASYGRDHRVSGYLWDDIALNRVEEYSTGDDADGFVIEENIHETGLEISYPKFTTAYGTKVSFKHGVWEEAPGRYDGDGLKVINMPVLKRHSIYHMTGAVKAYVGVVANQLTGHRPHNSVGSGGMGALMAETRIPALNIMDMIWIGANGGPGTKYDMALDTKMIAASTDPVALDYWAAKNVLLPHVGEQHRAQIDPDGKAPGSFGDWLKLSAGEIRKKYPAMDDADKLQIIEG